MMIRMLILLMSLAAGPVVAQCRQALALGLDVSGSVDGREYRLQLDGLAAALLRPEVEQLILSDPAAPIRLAVFEWSEASFQRLLINWTAVRTPLDLHAIAQRLRATQRASAPQGTAVGAAMQYGASLLAGQGGCWKRTLDLSGDGKHNVGPHPRAAKSALGASGITINGLVIGADSTGSGDKRYVQIGELSAYYNAWVILGPGAFVETALGFDAYEDAMTRKLIRELDAFVLSQAEMHPARSQ